MSEEIGREPVDWEPLAAGLCFFLAVLSLAFGFVFTTRWVLDEHVHPFLHDIGLGLLILGIPVMILGGHFMDLRDKKIARQTF